MNGCRKTSLNQPLNRAHAEHWRAQLVSVDALEDVGIRENGHMMMLLLEKNSGVIIEFIDDWMKKNVK